MEFLIGIYIWVAFCAAFAIFDEGDKLGGTIWKLFIILGWPFTLTSYAVHKLIRD
jgi:hypothetical protein